MSYRAIKTPILFLLAIALAVACKGIASAQVVTLKDVDGRMIACVRSGLFSSVEPCGTKGDWYTYVFVGSISEIKHVAKDEDELKIIPEEVFRGNPSQSITVTTLQAPCVPKLSIGDRWLLFLRQDQDQPITLDLWATNNQPVADAQQRIEELRHLKAIGDFGLLRGHVANGNSLDSDSRRIRDAHVLALRLSDGLQFSTTTSDDGSYEFEPLPPGKYKVTALPTRSLKSDDEHVDLDAGACFDVKLGQVTNTHSKQ